MVERTEWYNRKIKGIPKNERICIREYTTNEQIKYIVTCDTSKNYKLYSFDNESNTAIYTKHKSNNPLKLEQYMNT